MKTHLFVLAMMLMLATGLTVGLACSGGDDDDTDADSGASPDQSTDGVCFWQCEEDQGTTSSCLTGFASLEECGTYATENCAGTLLQTDWTAYCTSCDDTSCRPEWYSAD